MMYIERDRHGIRIYPFAPTDAEPRHLAAAGYLEVCAQDYNEFKGKVRFNISIDWLTAEKWAQLQEAMAKALELSGTPQRFSLSDDDEDADNPEGNAAWE